MTDFSLKKHVVGKDGFIWWIGQVVSDSYQENYVGSTAGGEDLEEMKGFGERYQVRIMGYHTADPFVLPDDQLPWASVMYPVTAGGGVTTKERSSIAAGNFVYGFFLDGDDAQNPVIMGILGYNQYDPLYKKWAGLPGFVPHGEWKTTPVPNYDINLNNEEKGKDTQTASSQAGGKKSTNDRQSTGTTPGDKTLEPANQREDGTKKENVGSPTNCDKKKSPKGIRQDIANMLVDVENAQKGLANLRYSLTNPIAVDGAQVGIQEYIQNKVNVTAKAVSGFIEYVFTEMYAKITNGINKGLKALYPNLDPAQQQKAKDASETMLDLLACFIRRIIKNLLKMVGRILLDLVNRFINVPLCAAETILAAILGKLTGLINGFMSQIMKPLQAILGAIDLVGAALDFIEQILSFLDCQDKPECGEIDEWSIWDGPDPPVATFDVNSLIGQVKNFAGTVSEVTDPDNYDFDADLDFSDVFNIEGCITDAFPCGPPKVVFWGGSGKGATGNAIVSAAGDLLGVDIINSGSGYEEKKPFLSIKDECGKGRGGYGKAILGPVCLQDDGTYVPCDGGEYTGVVGVLIEGSGYGYLPVPDGSLGGEGRTWAEPDQTTVHRSNGTWDLPYSPGQIIAVQPRDRICLPPGSNATLNFTDDTFVELLGGCTDIDKSGIVTAPVAPDKAVAPESEYPVVLYICDIIITNPGLNYQEGDEIVVEPANGAKLTPTFNELGQLTSVKIMNGGEGFKEIPKIYIESEIGFNAEMIPKFCVDRTVGVDEFSEPTAQDKVISVVDCVGTV